MPVTRAEITQRVTACLPPAADSRKNPTKPESPMYVAPTLPQMQTGMPRPRAGDDGELRQAASELEATFLAEMLNHAGFGRTSESFGGGIGEDQFASFLVQEQARELVRSGGIGLAEQLFRALSGGRDGEQADAGK